MSSLRCFGRQVATSRGGFPLGSIVLGAWIVAGASMGLVGCADEYGTDPDARGARDGSSDGASGGDGSVGNDTGDFDGTPGDDTGTGGDGGAGDGGVGDGAAACTITPSPEPFRNPAMQVHWRAAAGTRFANIDNVCSTPAVANIVPEPPDSEPIPEVAFITFDCAGARRAVLRVLSGRRPFPLVWSQNGSGRPNDETATFELRWDGHPAIGDLDGNLGNGPEIVAVTVAGGLIAYHGATGDVFWRIAAALPGATGPNPSISIADLDTDGVPEVIIGSAVINGRTGMVRWQGTAGNGVNGQGPLSVVSDLDGDGRQEVIAGRTVYESDGRVRFTIPSSTGFSAVGDVLDAAGRSGRDGVPEVITMSGGTLLVLDVRSGTPRTMLRIEGMSGAGGAPTIADFDGDGNAEIGVAGADRYTLFDPGCTAAGGGCLRAGIRWAAVTEDTSSAVTSSTVFDFNGDGASEVVYNDEERFMVLDGRTGRLVFQNWNPSQTRTEQPIVADATGDGQADIVFGANVCADFAGDTIPAALRATERVPGLEIWTSSDGSWVHARPVWNEHGYHIDNINDDGSIPMREMASWAPMRHNTFRLNRARGNSLLAPDLTATPEPSSCAPGMVQICVTVHNRGDARVGALRVGVYDRDPRTMPAPMPVGTAMTTGVLLHRSSQRVCVPVPMPTMTTTRYFVRVDDASAARECNEDNNVIETTLVCGPG